MKQKGKKAFTLIEIMIVISILALMMIVGYAPYNFYQQKAKVKIAGREISQSIYEARNFAISGKAFTDGSDEKNKSIGIVFEQGKNKIIYYSFPLYENLGNSTIQMSDAEKIDSKKIQSGVVFGTVKQGNDTSSKLLLFFEAITGKLYIKDIDGAKVLSETKAIDIQYGIKGVTDPNSSLLQNISYFPKTNTTFYKTAN